MKNKSGREVPNREYVDILDLKLGSIYVYSGTSFDVVSEHGKNDCVELRSQKNYGKDEYMSMKNIDERHCYEALPHEVDLFKRSRELGYLYKEPIINNNYSLI